MSSTLTLSTLRMPVAAPRAESPLPLLRNADLHASVSGDELDIEYGKIDHLLPYHAQDDYGREPVERDLSVAVLENEWLTATFLLDLGGRLWSLVDRRTGRELLYKPAALQTAHLALRNAWFAGGVEWNLGTTGHWPLTCSPLHAGRVEGADGVPVLRMWEYERMRRLVVQIDAWLPPDSRVLYVRPRLHNPHGETVPVYWWSNVAVPETDASRVLAPAETAWHFGYGAYLEKATVPGPTDGYPTRANGSGDYFYDIPAESPRWIAAVDQNGSGLFQASTRPLRGRKLFYWGSGQGGQHWQEWLGDGRYIEIQAGIARTQLEHVPLPAGDTWAWTEAYGPISVDPQAAHADWSRASEAAGTAVSSLVTDLAAEDAAAETWAAAAPVERLSVASGWGALEVRTGGLPANPATPFDGLGAPQQPWLQLWDSGTFPTASSTVVGPQWTDKLAALGDDWHALLHLGVQRYSLGDRAGAADAWRKSVALKANPLALRNLGVVAENPTAAAALLTSAHALLPGNWQLTNETLVALLAADQPADALTLIDGLDSAQRAHGRIRLDECRAALAAGNLERAGAILHGPLEISDLREGEDSIGHLWSDYQQAAGTDEPLPYRFDFRMHPEPATC